ncbi:Modifier of protein aggregation 4 [Taenia solium]|eukprot:TsM_000950900 transcript=TsM_000950900 gene=TsM_000950900
MNHPTSGNQRELARQKNQQKQKENQKKSGSKDKAGNKGLTLEERRQRFGFYRRYSFRDAAALQAKQAKKNSEAQQNT